MKDMLGREELITVEDALKLLLNYAPFKRPPENYIPIEKAYQMFISRDIISPEDLPAFNRSTVDGYAVLSSDTFGATESLPSYLKIKAEILMGEKPEFTLGRGEVAKISTGGMLPDGADAVVMFEHIQCIDENTIEVIKPVFPGENVIQAGEDAKKGEIILKAGHRLRPQDLGALAGLGITGVWAYERPKVAIISTGDEIVSPDKPLNLGQVRDINSYTLYGLIIESGGEPIRKGIFKDQYEIIKDIVKSSLKESEMILISGGSSVGTRDTTAKVINDIGKPGILFHGVSLKPGKPTIGGIIENIPVFGLPGHPVAVHVCFEIFIRPVLQILLGSDQSTFNKKKYIKARIAKNISSSPGREEHIGVVLEEREGELWAIPLLGKSGLITTLTKADGTAIIPLRKFGVHKGDFVDVRFF